jgi:cytoskeletal protein RodZ
MFKTLRDKITLSGTIVLMVGVALLIFTFASAYGFLAQGLSIITSGDLVRTFGEALAPLITTSIHIMYLGIMGWVGSILTIRGVTILSQARQTTVVPEEVEGAGVKQKPQFTEKQGKAEKVEKPESESKKPEAKPPEIKPKETKPEETKPYEPEIIILNPEPIQQTAQKPQQPQKEEKQNSS